GGGLPPAARATDPDPSTAAAPAAALRGRRAATPTTVSPTPPTEALRRSEGTKPENASHTRRVRARSAAAGYRAGPGPARRRAAPAAGKSSRVAAAASRPPRRSLPRTPSPRLAAKAAVPTCPVTVPADPSAGAAHAAGRPGHATTFRR